MKKLSLILLLISSLSFATSSLPPSGVFDGVGTPITSTCTGGHCYLDINPPTSTNLTGPITSSAGVTAVAAQTGTGSTFVMQASPTLTTPVIGAATGTSLSVSGSLTSTVATGTAPLVVSSTTQVANLNAATAGTATNLAGGSGGSIPYQSAASASTFLANGSAGMFLMSQGGASAPIWTFPEPVTASAYTSAHAIGATEHYIKVNPASPASLTMPDPVANRWQTYTIEYSGTGTVLATLIPNGSETFQTQGLASLHLSCQNESWVLISDGVNWFAKSHYVGDYNGSFTPVVTSSGGGVATGTVTKNLITYYRHANRLHEQLAYVQTAAGTTGTGVYLWPLPAGRAVDTTLQPVNTTAGQNNVGESSIFETGWTNGPGYVGVYDSTHLALVLQGLSAYAGSGSQPFGQAAAVFQIAFEADMPIANWEP